VDRATRQPSERRQGTERHAEPEHRAPSERPGQDAAKERPDDQTQRSKSRPDADGAGALGGIPTRRIHQRERRGKECRRSDALENPRRDQRTRCRREGACGRRRSEGDEAEHEYAAAAESIRHVAGAEHQAPQRQGVAVHNPLELASARGQPRGDAVEGYVHDRHVEEHEEVPQTGQTENQCLT